MPPRCKLDTILTKGNSATTTKGQSSATEESTTSADDEFSNNNELSPGATTTAEPNSTASVVTHNAVHADHAPVTQEPNVDQPTPSAGVSDIRKLLHDKGLLNRELPERFHEILTWSQPETQTFSVHRLPTNLVWERTVNFKASASNVMHVQGASDPCIVWILGEVVNPWFFDSQGEPMKIPSITVTPIFPATVQLVKRLLATHLAPPVNAVTNDTFNIIRASTFSTERKRGVRAAEPVTLKNIYDATESLDGYRVTGLQKRMDASFITKGDIVLLEVTVSRYRDRDAPTGDNWRKVLNIHSISLLLQSES